MESVSLIISVEFSRSVEIHGSFKQTLSSYTKLVPQGSFHSLHNQSPLLLAKSLGDVICIPKPLNTNEAPATLLDGEIDSETVAYRFSIVGKIYRR